MFRYLNALDHKKVGYEFYLKLKNKLSVIINHHCVRWPGWGSAQLHLVIIRVEPFVKSGRFELRRTSALQEYFFAELQQALVTLFLVTGDSFKNIDVRSVSIEFVINSNAKRPTLGGGV